MAIFGDFFASCISSEPRAAGFSDLRLKFALRPQHVWKYGKTSNLRPLRLSEEKKKEEEERNHRAKI